MSEARHVPALDGLRALAILLVIPHNSNILPDHPGWMWPLATLYGAGWTGVQLFFVLSGYLITGKLMDARAQPHRLRNFYLRRALRILPLYYLALFAGLVLLPLLLAWPPADGGQRIGAASLWLFMNNWIQPWGYTADGYSHFWSLAVEEQFYLLWPWVVWRWQAGRLLAACGVLAVAALAFRLALHAAQAPVLATYTFSVCRMDALVIGAAAAVLARRDAVRAWLLRHGRLLPWLAAALLAAGAACSHGYARAGLANIAFGYPLLAACFALLLLLLVARDGARERGWLDAALGTRGALSVGRVSYGMYVLHLPIALALGHWFPAEAATGSLAALAYPASVAAFSYIAALACHAWIERPFLRLKDRLAPAAA